MNELDMLRLAQPEVPDPKREILDAARAGLVDAGADRPRRLAARTFTRRRLMVVGAIGAAAAVGIPLLPDGSPVGTRPASAAVVLNQAAAAARADTSVAPKPGQWIYVESKQWGVPGIGILLPPGEDRNMPRLTTTSVHVQSWIPSAGAKGPRPPDKCFRVRGRMECFRSLASSAGVLWVNGREHRFALFPNIPKEADFDNFEVVRALPTESAALLRRIYQFADRRIAALGSAGQRDELAFAMIADLLDGWTSPRLRAALYEALARIPGVTLDRDAADPMGRRGFGFSRTGERERRQIILDRSTYRYLGDKVFTIGAYPDRGVKAGALARWTAQVRIAVVDKARQMPK